MISFFGVGKVVKIESKIDNVIGIETGGKNPQKIPLFFGENITRPELGDLIVVDGRVILNKKGFMFLRVSNWAEWKGKSFSKWQKSPVGETSDEIPF